MVMQTDKRENEQCKSQGNTIFMQLQFTIEKV